mmetsp:Transcript_1761/g.2430  ORF Transcript_1761/g.2430 Transcript_1761/m.2430 type:complete len:253 (-) Transcript_1761:1102-1860(-)|eukprot:CAMPEP_0178895634 /NCGR_PEP_ID=MMETSP0786-20121207/699_1 /TAXON_ID=186022 /ORGANISM="Thalassionema frauenfeldii, Strain CCMP 1798" /LENGTH=252 /DNA_ID=CAMNT_0020565893 /DNA_START=110 /DNA_END=868 /DNA_ORIENTATION=+
MKIKHEAKMSYSTRRGKLFDSKRNRILFISISLNIFLIFCLVLLIFTSSKEAGSKLKPTENVASSSTKVTAKPLVWHGGHPDEDRPGQCFRGADHYCMCTPSLAIDLIIASGSDHVWLVRRKDTDQLATMGGFVNVGETVETAVARELKEEMGVDLNDHKIQLVGVYSDPRRDNRRHTASVVFAVHLDSMHPYAGDDAKDVQRIPLSSIEEHDFFADHRTILLDYKKSVGLDVSPGNDDGVQRIERSICNRM